MEGLDYISLCVLHAISESEGRQSRMLTHLSTLRTGLLETPSPSSSYSTKLIVQWQ